MADVASAGDKQGWRQDARYRYTDTLPRRAWAWEFLRRNPDYRKTWADVSAAAKIEFPTPGLTRITASAELDELARWGIFFR